MIPVKLIFLPGGARQTVNGLYNTVGPPFYVGDASMSKVITHVPLKNKSVRTSVFCMMPNVTNVKYDFK